MSNVMQQYSSQQTHLLFIGNFMLLQSQLVNSELHEMHRTNRVLEAIVHCTRIHQVRKAQLGNSTQALKPWMINQIEDKWMSNGDKPIDRIIDDFALVLIHVYTIAPQN